MSNRRPGPLHALFRISAFLGAGILGTFLCANLFADQAFAQYSLKSRRDFDVGDHPQTVLAVDFDNDGQLDLMSADELSNYISLLKGFGDGTFRRTQTLVAGSKPTDLVFTDVNRDGFPDIVAANFLSQNVTVNLGNGTGVFGSAISSPVSAGPFNLTVGDWNGDGIPDIATANSSQNNVSIMRGTGSGAFNNLVQITTGTQPNWILSADFNGDGKLDLAVVCTASDSVQIWRNNGTGTFTLNLTLNVGAGSGPSSATAADLNGDGRPDLVVAARSTSQVKVYIANTTGGFNNPTTLNSGLGPRAIAVDDLNKDGFPDLFIGQSQISGVGEMAIFTGNGSGTTWTGPTVYSIGPTPIGVATGDFNRDGNVDVVTSSLTGDVLSVLQTTAPGAFIVADKITLGSTVFPSAVAVADFDRDGKPDVIVTDEANDQAFTARNNGTGQFLAPVSISTGNGSGPEAVVILDDNADGWPDAVVTDANNDTLSILQNGAGTLTATNGIAVNPPCDDPIAIATGDINADGRPDIAYACDISYHICTRRGTGSAGASAFGAQVCTFVDKNPEGVAIGTFDFDALQDFAFTSDDPTTEWMDVAMSNGVGGFTDIPSSFPTGTGPKGIARGDLNGDGYADLVVANSLSNTVSALLGDGGGDFSFPSIESPAGEAPNGVALADLNGDGILDAAVVNTNSNNVSFLLGDGFGNFVKAGDFGSRDLPVEIAIGDFNVDGKPDLAVADNYAGTVTILTNQTALGDPLQTASVIGQTQTVYRWGIVPGAVYDIIRGNLRNVVQGTGSINLGPVTCLANDLPDPDTSAFADTAVPPVGQGFFYYVRPVIGGVAGNYSVSSNGRIGSPSSGGCF